jgi:predicted amidohydrolase
MAILGADLIALPTNWPPGAECLAVHGINTRAMENAVYYVAANRIGTERGFRFIGQSRICDPHGTTLAEATDHGEEILYAEIDTAVARTKRIVRVPDKHIIDRMADRRPEMYGVLTEPHDLSSPGRD